MTVLKVGVVAALIAVVASLAVIVWWDSSRPVSVIVLGDPDATIVVDVQGAVLHPGIVTLPAGSRLDQAIAAAGGLSPDADVTRLYLAARVGDGEQIVVPGQAAPDSNPASQVTARVSSSLININLASEGELMGLPGVGEVLADRIVAYRTTNGPYASVEELADVDGIGLALLEELRPLVTTGE